VISIGGPQRIGAIESDCFPVRSHWTVNQRVFQALVALGTAGRAGSSCPCPGSSTTSSSPKIVEVTWAPEFDPDRPSGALSPGTHALRTSRRLQPEHLLGKSTSAAQGAAPGFQGGRRYRLMTGRSWRRAGTNCFRTRKLIRNWTSSRFPCEAD
jgi:hypothetical protein